MAALVPVVYFGAAVSLSVLAINASPDGSLGLIGHSVSLALLAFLRVTDVTSWAELSSLLGFFVLLWIAHVVRLLVLDRAAPPSDWRKILFDFREIDTTNCYMETLAKHKATDGTVASEKKECRATNGSSKRSGHRTSLLKRLTSALVILLLSHVFTNTYSQLLQLSYDDFHPSTQSYLRRIHNVTIRETTIRSWLVFNFVWSSRAMFTAAHNIFAFACVTFGIDERADWPRLYGSIFEAYSVRRFWGKFWHHLAQRNPSV